jgi:hypothetical protein
LAAVTRTIKDLSDRARQAGIPQIPDPKDRTRKIPEPRAKAVTDAVFAKHLGDLKDHTLVIVTHGLQPPHGDQNSDRFVGPRDVREHGLLFHNAAPGFNAADTVLQVQHLQHMMLELTPPDPVIHVRANQERLDKLKPSGSLDLTDSDIAVLRRDVPRWVPVMEALRQSVFTRIYLAACGPKARLHKFADLFQLGVHKDVYFNNARIFVTTGARPFAEVGTEAPGGFVLHDGKKFFSPDKVPLQTTPTSFLAGAEILFAKNSKTREPAP